MSLPRFVEVEGAQADDRDVLDDQQEGERESCCGHSDSR